jgi:superoxide dismutase
MPENKPESKPKNNPKSDPKSKTNNNPKSNSKSNPKSNLKSNPENKPKSNPKSKTKSKTKSKSESKPIISRSRIIAAEYYQKYVQATNEATAIQAIKKSSAQLEKTISKISRKKSSYAYAAGKWTLHELLRHVIDTERVFAYRALSFSRKDQTPLPSFDQDHWAENANAGQLGWDELKKEFKAVRKSTEFLFASFNEEQLLQVGSASGNPINVLGLGFVIAGHRVHHQKIIKEKYLAKK